MDKLVELPYPEWPKLRDLYKEWHMYSSSYQMIQCFIDWLEKEPEIPLKFFTLNGEWETDGTFIVKFESFSLLVFSNTLDENPDRLTRAMNCLPTNRPILFFAMQEHVAPAFQKHCQGLGIENSETAIGWTFWFHLPREEALKFEINPPEGVTLRQLQVENAEEVNNNWPHREPNSIIFVERMIKSNLSVGAFDPDGNLIAYSLRLPVGSLGLLKVIDTHKRQGLGSLVVRYMAKNLASLGFDVTAPVVTDNTPSKSMFTKLGFKVIDKVGWGHRPAIE